MISTFLWEPEATPQTRFFHITGNTPGGRFLLPPLWPLYPSVCHYKASLFWTRVPQAIDSPQGKQNWACSIMVGQLESVSRAVSATWKTPWGKQEGEAHGVTVPCRAHRLYTKTSPNGLFTFSQDSCALKPAHGCHPSGQLRCRHS